jgi:hypothetical protein
MCSLSDIIRENARYVRDSGYAVEYCEILPTVSIGLLNKRGVIDDLLGESVFLQEHEADDFMDQAKNLYEEAGDVLQEDCMLSVAKSYIDALD